MTLDLNAIVDRELERQDHHDDELAQYADDLETFDDRH